MMHDPLPRVDVKRLHSRHICFIIQKIHIIVKVIFL